MPRHSHDRPRAASALIRTLTTLAVAAGLATSMAACTGGGDDKPEAQPTPTPTTAPAAPVRVVVDLARVAGSSTPAIRKRVVAQLTATLQKYADDALLGTYPRSDFSKAFSQFTSGAAVQARRDRSLLTGVEFAGAKTVTPVALRARISLLSPRRHPAGATAQVRFVLAVDEKPVTLAGRLLLTPGKPGWRIFGYDLHRGDLPAGGQG